MAKTIAQKLELVKGTEGFVEMNIKASDLYAEVAEDVGSTTEEITAAAELSSKVDKAAAVKLRDVMGKDNNRRLKDDTESKTVHSNISYKVGDTTKTHSLVTERVREEDGKKVYGDSTYAVSTGFKGKEMDSLRKAQIKEATELFGE